MRKQVSLHPVLFALFPSLFIFAINMGEFSPDVVLLPMAVTLALVLLCWLLLSLAVKSREKAAVMLSLFLLPFFSYGYLGRFWPLVAGLFLLVGSFVLRTEGRIYAAGWILNVMATALVVMSVVSIGAVRLGDYRLARILALEDSPLMPDWGSDGDNPISVASLPDIYYIILDGYARADVLDELYQFDNSGFIHSLEQRGFYVAGNSMANYSQTSLSLAASLNMEYLDGLAARVGLESSNRQPVMQMVQQSLVFRFLKEYGYKLVAFSTMHRPSDLRHADVYLAPRWTLSKFQMALLDTTPLPTILARLTSYDEYESHRKRLLFALDHLAEVPDQDGPVFVFAHLWTPHPPFVFGEHGEKVNPQQRLTFADGSLFLYRSGLTAHEYRDNYTKQLTFLNQRISSVVDEILANAIRPSVIVLQADHGPGSGLEWEEEDAMASDMKERLAIFNAYYLPGGSGASLYDGISPVNTFRLILNRYFGTEYELLPDESYFSTYPHPYRFIAVGDEIQ
jgi:hypothetical protein